MAESDDGDEKDEMDAMTELPPLTRADVDAKIAAITERVARGELRHREELEIWGGALAEKLATKDNLAALEKRMATKDDLTALEKRMASKDDLAALEERLLAELARHATAIQESVASQLRVFDDKYKHLVAKPRRGRPS